MKTEVAPQKIVVDGNELFWQLRHGWVLDQIEGLKGVSVSVWSKPGRTRELIIDFPFSVFGLKRSPRQSDLLKELPAAIHAAIENGWDPESRGRTARYAVPAPETT